MAKTKRLHGDTDIIMAPPDHIIPVGKPHDIALSLIQPSTTNPRKNIDDDYIIDLAKSMSGPAGLIHPITVRTLGKDKFEIVSGECRFHAAKMLKWSSIPAVVREVSDADIFEFQLIENLQRQDLNAMDEAVAFKTLLDKESLDWLCSKIHKSKKYVQDRLKLNDLVVEARDLVSVGVLPLTHALMISKLPEVEQQKCIEECCEQDYLDGDGDMVCTMTVNELKHFIEDDLMIDFEHACFDAKAADLVPEAGACSTCPKRTCNQNLLFEEITKEDMCTDAKCFHGKEEAHVKKSLKDAKEEFGKERVASGQFEKYGRDKVKFKGVSLPWSETAKKDTDICVVITKEPDSFRLESLGKKVFVDASKLKRTITAKENGKANYNSSGNGKSYEERNRDEFVQEKMPKLLMLPELLQADNAGIMKVIRPLLRSLFNNYNFEVVAGAAHALGLFENGSTPEVVYNKADKTKYQDQPYWYDQIIDAVKLDNLPKVLLTLSVLDGLENDMKARPEAKWAKECHGGLYWSEIAQILKPKPAGTKKAAAKPEKKAPAKKSSVKKLVKKNGK